MIFKIITLGLMAAFYICYFAKMMSQRKQGISTDQLGKGKTGLEKFIEVTLKISTYVLPISTKIYKNKLNPNRTYATANIRYICI